MTFLCKLYLKSVCYYVQNTPYFAENRHTVKPYCHRWQNKSTTTTTTTITTTTSTTTTTTTTTSTITTTTAAATTTTTTFDSTCTTLNTTSILEIQEFLEQVNQQKKTVIIRHAVLNKYESSISNKKVADINRKLENSGIC